MSTWITNNFDIDLWIKLAGDHPFKFEQQRGLWIEHAIENATSTQQPRLQGLKWEIDMDIQIAKNKYTNCKNISHRLINHLQAIKDILAGETPFFFDRPAKILDFAARTD